MKKAIVKLICLSCFALLGVSSVAQNPYELSPAEFKDYVDANDGSVFFDNYGLAMGIGEAGNIKKQLEDGGSSDKAIYENLQLCQSMYKSVDCIPHYVAIYVTNNFDAYQSYYSNYLSKNGDVNDAAAALLLLTGFNGKCKGSLKSYDKFSKLCANYTTEGAYDIVKDSGKNNDYRGATFCLLSGQLLKMVKSNTISEIPDKTKKNLIKVYESLLKDCNKINKKNDPLYEDMPSYIELYELILNSLK